MAKKNNNKKDTTMQQVTDGVSINTYKFENKKDPNQRDFELRVIVGGNGVGKSVFIREGIINPAWSAIVKAGLQDKKRIVVHDVSNSKSFSDLQVLSYGDLFKPIVESSKRSEVDGKLKGIMRLPSMKAIGQEAEIKALTAWMQNGIFIADEADTWQGSEKVKEWQDDLYAKFRNDAYDLYLVFHALGQIPKKLRPRIAQFDIFKTGEVFTENQLKSMGFRNPSELHRCIEKVNAVPYDNSSKVQFSMRFRPIK